MEHQKCRLCNERHPIGPCPSYVKASKEMLKDISPKILKKIPEMIRRAETKIKRDLDALGCPVCEARRLRQIEAQKRYREKKNGLSKP